MTGRPSVYTPEIAERICMEMASGRSLRSICKDQGMPARSTVQLWHVTNHEGFSDQYTRAQALRVEELVDEAFDIADNASNDWMANNDPENPGWRANGDAINRDRIRIDLRKWYAGKIAPKLFGDRITHAGDKDAPIEVVDHGAEKRAKAVLALIAAASKA